MSKIKYKISINNLKKHFKPMTEEEQFLFFVHINDIMEIYGSKYEKSKTLEDENKYALICGLFATCIDMMSSEDVISQREFMFNSLRNEVDKRSRSL